MSEAAAGADNLHDVKKLTEKHIKITQAINTAIQTFSEKLKEAGDEDNKKYAEILDELMTAITKDRDVIAKAEADAKSKTRKNSDPEPVSKQMSIVHVNNFIDSQKDAIFVVTGGSFNPPHNGHIGMFQKAYDELMKVEINNGKKVYGVMVPASDDWIEKKLCKEATGKSEDCNDTEFTAEKSQAAINSKRIKLVNRVTLCKLSCDSYAWTSDPTSFNASNMIVVNQSAQGEQFTLAENTYYLCGSDYYARVREKYTHKFICVLRSGVKRDTGGRANQIHFSKPPIDGSKTAFDVKPDDIIIEDDGGDNDASSTMLREMLTAISKIVVTEDGALTGDLPDKDKLLALISIPVLRKLLELKYILTDADRPKLDIIMDLDEEDEKAERAKNMDKVGETIKLNVDIGSEVRDLDKRVTKKFNRIETGGGGDCLFHTLRYLLTTAGKFKPIGDKTVDMMTIRNDIVDHVKKLGNEFKHLHVAIGNTLDFKKSNAAPERAPLNADPVDETAKQGINVDGGVRTNNSMVLFSDRVVTVRDEPVKLGEGKVMKYVSQDKTRNYFTVMKEKGTYGTDFELGIAAALYDIKLCVISDQETCQYYICDKTKHEVRGIDPGEYERIKKNIWYIYNYTNTHYQYLKCIDAPAECPDPVKP